MNADFAAALLDPALPCPPGLRTWNGSDPAARFAVHRNNVTTSLVDALADNLPVVQALVGIAFFRAMATLFVRRSPPRSPVLAHYGDEIPAFIERFEPARSVPYLADMVRLETARRRAFHAADAAPVAAADLQRALACGDRAGALRLGWHASVAVVASPFAIVSLWAAHQVDPVDDAVLAQVDPHVPETALILRDGLDVLVQRLPNGAAAFIASVRDGSDFATAANDGISVDAAFDLQGTLALLMRHGALVSVHLPRNSSE